MEDLEEQFREELAQEAAELDGGEAIIEDAEEYLDIINGASDEYRGFTMEIPEEPARDFDRERWNESQRIGNRVARDFRNRLLREKRSKVKRGKRRGQFDRSRMVHAARGSTRVFKKEEEGDEKDYSCMVVLDRSGSMSSDGINEAEMAVTALTSALEDVGVDSSVLDLYHSEARLVKSFGQETKDVKEHLVNSSASGGTPLTEVLHLARERVSDHDNPFMIVITDGRPGSPDTYREELDKCHFPVLGVYLTGNQKPDDEKYFHRQVYVNGRETDELRTKLHNLANEVLF
jgi:Mg-chelatase subunit ChlD